MNVLLVLLDWVFTLYYVALIARALLPWLGLSPYHPVMRFLILITNPILAPLRRRIRPVGGLDFTPMIAIAILWVVQIIVRQLLQSLALLL